MIAKKEFIPIALDLEDETFIVYITSIFNCNLNIDVPLSYRVQIALLIVDEVSIAVPSKYANIAEIFLSDFAIELSNNTRINNHLIDQINSLQLFIYSLRLVKSEILKTYINTNLTSRFLKSLKSPGGSFILFAKKPDKSY